MFDTLGSAFDFDTIVAVYRGTSISNLIFITCSDDAVSPLGPSVVSWQAQADKTYYIQVGGYSNDVGQLVVSFTKQP